MNLTDAVIAQRLVNKRNDAMARGIYFNLSFKRMKQLMNQKTCFYTGVPFTGFQPKKGSIPPHCWTLDRVENEKGYTDDNVVACTFEFNQLKKNLDSKSIKLLFKGLVKVQARNEVKRKKVVKLAIVKSIERKSA